jgi:hypothetical protein
MVLDFEFRVRSCGVLRSEVRGQGLELMVSGFGF